MSYVYSVVVISNEYDPVKKQALVDALNLYMKLDDQLGNPFSYLDTKNVAGKKSYEHHLLVGAVNYGDQSLLVKMFNEVDLDEPAILIITSPEGNSEVYTKDNYLEDENQ